MSGSELTQASTQVELKQEERFEQLNLKEIGLQLHDFAEVMDANEELAEISTTVVAEYGKNIAKVVNGSKYGKIFVVNSSF